MRSILLCGSLLWVVAGAGCAGAQLQTDASTSAIRAAEEVGAKDVPRAALHLQLAKESLNKATSLSEQGDEERAQSLLTRAQADAELAVALSREDSEKQQANKALERVRQLRLANPQGSIQ